MISSKVARRFALVLAAALVVAGCSVGPGGSIISLDFVHQGGVGTIVEALP